MKKFAVYDFDGTLVRVQTPLFLLKCWKKFKYSTIQYYLVYATILTYFVGFKLRLYRGLTKDQFRSNTMVKILKLFKHMKKEEVDVFFEKAAEEVATEFSKVVINSIRADQKNGYCCILLSGNYLPFLKNVGKQLQFDEVVGSDIYFQDDYIDLHYPTNLIEGINKVSKLKQFLSEHEIDWTDSKAYGDSVHDKEILHMVHFPIVVNPDEQMRMYALEQNWEIIED